MILVSISHSFINGVKNMNVLHTIRIRSPTRSPIFAAGPLETIYNAMPNKQCGYH